mmetsp:Transcript_12744/g.28083  ORF Transcript_12744/g.28083 Transcript_12744/m.28083 type:complete len:272 (-) Transcript_12744:431-1246(-)
MSGLVRAILIVRLREDRRRFSVIGHRLAGVFEGHQFQQSPGGCDGCSIHSGLVVAFRCLFPQSHLQLLGLLVLLLKQPLGYLKSLMCLLAVILRIENLLLRRALNLLRLHRKVLKRSLLHREALFQTNFGLQIFLRLQQHLLGVFHRLIRFLQLFLRSLSLGFGFLQLCLLRVLIAFQPLLLLQLLVFVALHLLQSLVGFLNRLLQALQLRLSLGDQLLGVLLRVRGGFDGRLGGRQEGVALEGCHEDLLLLSATLLCHSQCLCRCSLGFL